MRGCEVMDANKMGEYVECLVRYLEPSLRRKAFLTVMDVSGALKKHGLYGEPLADLARLGRKRGHPK